MEALDGKQSAVTLLERPADDFKDLDDNSFDTVIINSVVQYFPSLEYLTKVLDGAIKATKPGGAIFVGDVRSLPLLEAWSASVELFPRAVDVAPVGPARGDSTTRQSGKGAVDIACILFSIASTLSADFPGRDTAEVGQGRQ